MNRLYIEICDGNVEAVYSETDLDVVVIDRTNMFKLGDFHIPQECEQEPGNYNECVDLNEYEKFNEYDKVGDYEDYDQIDDSVQIGDYEEMDTEDNPLYEELNEDMNDEMDSPIEYISEMRYTQMVSKLKAINFKAKKLCLQVDYSTLVLYIGDAPYVELGIRHNIGDEFCMDLIIRNTPTEIREVIDIAYGGIDELKVEMKNVYAFLKVNPFEVKYRDTIALY